MTKLIGPAGFASPVSTKRIKHCRLLGIELFATVALAVSLLIAATAVSIGVARAQAFANFHYGDRAPVAVALIVGAVMVGVGGPSAIAIGERSPPD